MTDTIDGLQVDSPEHTEAMVDFVAAIARLGFAREQHPDLIRAEAHARVELAAAIMALDEAEDTAEERGAHTMHEQVAVEEATRRFAQALADLVRGEKA